MPWPAKGMGFMHCPPGFGERPPVTGWFAEFGELTAPPGSSVGYTSDAMRFMGATFDPSALYRFNAIQRDAEGEWADHRRGSRRRSPDSSAQLLDGIARHRAGRGGIAQPARWRAACPLPRLPRSRRAALVRRADGQDCVTDVRGDVLRIGFGLYHDEEDVDALLGAARRLA